MKKLKFQQYFHSFLVCVLVPYAFWFSYQQNIVIIPISLQFQYSYQSGRLLEGGAYFNADNQRCGAYLRLGAYQRKYAIQIKRQIDRFLYIYIYIYIYIINNFMSFCLSNVKKYNLTRRHLSYSYISILTNLLRTDNEISKYN